MDENQETDSVELNVSPLGGRTPLELLQYQAAQHEEAALPEDFSTQKHWEILEAGDLLLDLEKKRLLADNPELDKVVREANDQWLAEVGLAV